MPLDPPTTERPLSTEFGPCRWWLLCDNLATGTEDHLVLGEVPICDRCREKVARLRG